MNDNSLLLQMYRNGRRRAGCVGFWRPITVANVKPSITAAAYIKCMTGRMGTKTYAAPRQETATVSCFLSMRS